MKRIFGSSTWLWRTDCQVEPMMPALAVELLSKHRPLGVVTKAFVELFSRLI